MIWFKNNWFKFFLVMVLFIIAVEVFLVLYPYAVGGYQFYQAYPLSELFFPNKPDKNSPHIINPFEKQP